MSKTLVSSIRALVLPAALAGGLLIFGGQAASAAGDPVQYMVGGETITTQGGDASVGMVGNSLHVVVKSGTTAIKIGDDKETISVSAGDEIVLSPTGDGNGMSVALNVIRGQAVVTTTGQTSDEGTVFSVVTAESALSFSTGVDASDASADAMASAAQSDSDSAVAEMPSEN